MHKLTESTIKVLNEFHRLDPIGCQALIDNRVFTTEGVLNHPAIQVSCKEDGSEPKVGILGILNGVLETAGADRVAVVLDDKTNEIKEFIKYNP